MYVSKAGAKVRSQKDRIIKMLKNGIRVLDIAKKYHITESTMYKYFKLWGIKIIRVSKYEKREFEDRQKKGKKAQPWKPKYSPELLAQRAVNQKTNNDKIQFIKNISKDSMDARLIHNICNKAYI